MTFHQKSRFIPALFFVWLSCVPLFSSPASGTVAARPAGATFKQPLPSVEAIASDDLIDWSGSETATNSAFLVQDPFSASLRILTSLVIVIGLVFALSWFLQRRVGLGSVAFGKVLGILPLDSRRFIYLVDVMGKVLVLGVTEHQINVLSEITDKDQVDALRLEARGPSTIPGLEKMFSFLRRGPVDSNESQNAGATSEHLDRHTQQNRKNVDRLRDLLIQQRQQSPEDE